MIGPGVVITKAPKAEECAVIILSVISIELTLSIILEEFSLTASLLLIRINIRCPVWVPITMVSNEIHWIQWLKFLDWIDDSSLVYSSNFGKELLIKL